VDSKALGMLLATSLQETEEKVGAHERAPKIKLQIDVKQSNALTPDRSREREREERSREAIFSKSVCLVFFFFSRISTFSHRTGELF